MTRSLRLTLLHLIVVLALVPRSGRTAEEPSDSDPSRPCPEVITERTRQMAAKLHDALASHGFRFRPVDLGGTLEVSRSSARPLTFDVDRRRSGRAVALVDPRLHHRTTIVAVSTHSGPVVAWLEWPHADQIETGSACEPTGSRVVHPDVPWPMIDAKPLQWWGLRVLWRIPPSFNSGPASSETSIRDVVMEMYES
ncbi:MAG: hypothetical protein ABEL76_04330 [Bradymonadaceae bacterium]